MKANPGALEFVPEELKTLELCKAAVKGGRIYDSGHMRWICDRLLQKPDERGAVVRTCPHGRPVAFEIRKSAMDRQFGRLG